MEVTMSYVGSDEEEELKMVPVVINISDVNVVSNLESYSSMDNFKNDDNNFFDEEINDQVNASPHTTINAKVVQAMKSFNLCIAIMPTK